MYNKKKKKKEISIKASKLSPIPSLIYPSEFLEYKDYLENGVSYSSVGGLIWDMVFKNICFALMYNEFNNFVNQQIYLNMLNNI